MRASHGRVARGPRASRTPDCARSNCTASASPAARSSHWRRARRQRDPGRVLYLYGGAYCRPITSQHWGWLRWLVDDLHATVMVPLYPLAPESDCEAAVAAARAFQDLFAARHGAVDVLMGDSAGAGLCLATSLARRDAGEPLARSLVLLTPWVDLEVPHPRAAADAARDPMLALEGVREAGRLYAGTLGTDHPHASPLRAELRGLPPMRVVVGTRDLLHRDALAFVDKARASGCEVELQVGHDLLHAWPLLPVPEARLAREGVRRFVAGLAPAADD